MLTFSLLLVSLVSCSKKPIVEGEIDQLVWNTSGAGQIRFTVVPEGNNYKVHVESYEFKDVGLDVKLTPEDGQAFAVTKSIFKKERDIRDETFTPGGVMGTWTSITVVGKDGNETEVKNIDSGDLWKIKGFAASAARNANPESNSVATPSPENGTQLSEKSDTEKSDTKQTSTGPTEGSTIIWKTTGGGDIEFTVESKNEEFNLHVTRFEGTELDVNMQVPADSEAISIVKSIFASPSEFRVEEKKDSDVEKDSLQPLKGTWTTVTYVDASGNKFELAEAKEFRLMYDLAASLAQTNMPERELPELTPPPVPNDSDTTDKKSGLMKSQGNDNDEKVSTFEFSQMIWETAGGGQIEFTLNPDGDDFKIHLASYSFREQDVNLVLKPEDDKVYAIVKSIFAKQRDLKDDTFTPGGPTGTWTSITLVDQEGKKTTTKNIRPQGEMGLIYNFVKAAAKEPPPSGYNDGPEPSPPPVSDSKSKKLP